MVARLKQPRLPRPLLLGCFLAVEAVTVAGCCHGSADGPASRASTGSEAHLPNWLQVPNSYEVLITQGEPEPSFEGVKYYIRLRTPDPRAAIALRELGPGIVGMTSMVKPRPLTNEDLAARNLLAPWVKSLLLPAPNKLPGWLAVYSDTGHVVSIYAWPDERGCTLEVIDDAHM